MNLADVLLRHPTFAPDGREGRRAGYWCGPCSLPITVSDGDTLISWNFGSTFISGTHKACGHQVVSIWDDAPPTS